MPIIRPFLSRSIITFSASPSLMSHLAFRQPFAYVALGFSEPYVHGVGFLVIFHSDHKRLRSHCPIIITTIILLLLVMTLKLKSLGIKFL